MDKDLARFYEKTHKAECGCLEWTGTKKSTGYGRFWCDGEMRFAHRWLYQRLNDVVLTKEQVVMHSCDNPSCVSIDHLSVGSHKENTADMIGKGRGVSNFKRGTAHHDAKLDEEKVRQIRLSADTQRALAERYGVSTVTIRRVRQRKIWKHVA